MKIRFASDILKITFEDNEPYTGRDVTMRGEALYSGFDAALSTMEWLSSKSSVNEEEKQVICNLIKRHNETSNYIIMFMEE